MSELIDRQVAIDAIDEERKQRHLFNTAEDGLLEARRIINTLTPVQPERKKGEWIDIETSYADGVQQKCQCSVCKRLSQRPLGDFCKWCGADMRGGTNE